MTSARIPTAITLVEPAGGGTAFTAGTDYELRNGGIYIPSTSTITNPVSGAANIDVTYTYDAQDVVQGLVNSAKQYEIVFAGLNEARSGKPVRVRCHKVSGGVLWANLHLLFWLSLFPFATAWMGENHFTALPRRLRARKAIRPAKIFLA